VAGSVNKVILIGNLGNDPEVKSMNSGDRVCNLSIATSERWKDRSTGERQERTQWHRVVIFNQPLVSLAEQYLRKGSKVYLEGQLETRKWTDQSGVEKYSTEVVLRPYKGEMTMLDGRSDGASASGGGGYQDNNAAPAYGDSQPQKAASSSMGGGKTQIDEMEDEIPF
jgi:single-strand DNA-binding protein